MQIAPAKRCELLIGGVRFPPQMRRSGQSASDPIADIHPPCNLASMLVRWLIPLSALISSPVLAADQKLCGAMENLKREATRSGPQRVAIFKQEEMTFACGHKVEVDAQIAFCDAAAGSVGLEFTHAFPWLIYDCLRDWGIKPGLDVVDQYTGIKRRKKIVHLWAGWREGTRIDIRFQPSGDFGNGPQFKDYWGAYELVIWQPRLSP